MSIKCQAFGKNVDEKFCIHIKKWLGRSSHEINEYRFFSSFIIVLKSVQHFWEKGQIWLTYTNTYSNLKWLLCEITQSGNSLFISRLMYQNIFSSASLFLFPSEYQVYYHYISFLISNMHQMRVYIYVCPLYHKSIDKLPMELSFLCHFVNISIKHANRIVYDDWIDNESSLWSPVVRSFRSMGPRT